MMLHSPTPSLINQPRVKNLSSKEVFYYPIINILHSLKGITGF